MKAAVFLEKEKIEIQNDYPKPTPNAHEVLIKVDMCGVCGTDVKNYYHQMYQTPLIMGHEFGGEIVEIGSEVRNFTALFQKADKMSSKKDSNRIVKNCFRLMDT